MKKHHRVRRALCYGVRVRSRSSSKGSWSLGHWGVWAAGREGREDRREARSESSRGRERRTKFSQQCVSEIVVALSLMPPAGKWWFCVRDLCE